MRPDVLVLLTDFGADSLFVGIMKSVIIREVGASVPCLDLAHDLRPQDVVGAALALECAWSYLPEKAVVLVVVDPGVGSDRRAVAVELDQHRYLVGPDNGLLTPLLDRVKTAVQLPVPPHASPTFHGRDVFAPAAARLLRGEPLKALGTPLSPASLIRLAFPAPEETTAGWRGRILTADPFGNLLTSFHRDRLPPLPFSTLRVGPHRIPVVRTFAEVEEGELLAYWGSCGYLEIAVRNGSARDRLGEAPAPLLLERP